jgi:hypothetical protein
MTSSLRTLPLPPPPSNDPATGVAEAWVLGMAEGTENKGTVTATPVTLPVP